MCAKFRIKNLGKLRASLDAWGKRTKKHLSLALAAWADDLIADIGKELMSIGAVDQGLLYAATTRSQVEQVGTSLRVTIFNPMEYATVVEFGRGPGQGKPPPLLPLVGWAGRKGIISGIPRNIGFGGEWRQKWAASGAIFRAIMNKSGKTSKRTKRKAIDPDVLALLTVRFIAQKIFESGIQGRHPFSIAFDRKATTFAKDIGDALDLLK